MPRDAVDPRTAGRGESPATSKRFVVQTPAESPAAAKNFVAAAPTPSAPQRREPSPPPQEFCGLGRFFPGSTRELHPSARPAAARATIASPEPTQKPFPPAERVQN